MPGALQTVAITESSSLSITCCRSLRVSAGSKPPPLVLLSSFDASCLEFRKLMPLLEAAGVEAWAVDINGWGFTEAGVVPGSQEVLGPAERRAHLLEFCTQQVFLLLFSGRQI